jgi:hypothetical protein
MAPVSSLTFNPPNGMPELIFHLFLSDMLMA